MALKACLVLVFATAFAEKKDIVTDAQKQAVAVDSHGDIERVPLLDQYFLDSTAENIETGIMRARHDQERALAVDIQGHFEEVPPSEENHNADAFIEKASDGSGTGTGSGHAPRLETLKFLVGQQCKQLNAVGATYWLDRGTLVAAARGGGIAPWDDDADLAVLHSDAADIFSKIHELKQAEGTVVADEDANDHPYISFNIHHEHSDIVQLELVNGMLSDPYGHYHKNEALTTYGIMHRQLVNVHESVLLPVRDCTFLGFQCKCPRDIAAYLSSQYGANWYLPRPDFDGFPTEKMKKYLDRVITSEDNHLTPNMKAELRKMREDIGAEPAGVPTVPL